MIMSSNVRSPVEVQVPVSIPDGVGDTTIFKRELGLRRIIVQTDAGNVLDIELHRADKVQFIKKTVQALLHMPTEQSALLFGDHVLEDDLSEVRSDSPLLLTRELHRSSSTPCLSPTYDVEKHKNVAQPFETVGRSKCCPKIKKIMRESVKALEAGVQPVPAGGGLGGAYYFRNRHGMNIAIVKPTDEEPLAPNNPKGFVGKALGQPGLNRSIRVGETGVREVAAYLLDHDHFAKVPATALVKATHSIFNVNKVEFMGVSSQENSAVAKIGSFQQFVDHDYDASDCGTSRFPVSAVHRIGILDVRIFNTDRHAGNILVKKERERETYDYRSSHSSLRLEGGVELIPIDHGLCLPETLEDPYFEWLHWPQASFPFSEEELEYIRSLDPYKDADILRKELPMLREACLRMLILSTTFLQKAVEAGLCLSEIGAMMSREVCGVDDAVSELEVVCMLAKAQVEQEMSTLLWDADEITLGSPLKEENSADQFQFDMDHEELSWDRLYSPKLLKSPEAKPQSCRSPQSPCAVTAFGLTDFPLHHSPCSPSAFARPRGTFRTLSVLQELQPVEEEEGLINSSKFFPASPPSPCYSTSAAVSRPFLSRCSSSFNSRTHQFPNHFEPRKRGVKKTFGSQVPQALNSAQGPSMTPVVMSDMNGEAWMLFMDHFEILVQEAFARRKCESVGRLQRLGKSCQF